MEGRLRADKRRRDNLMSHAWHVEAFARTKGRLPDLARLLGGDEKPKAMAQTGPEMVEAMRAWVRHTTVH